MVERTRNWAISTPAACYSSDRVSAVNSPTPRCYRRPPQGSDLNRSHPRSATPPAPRRNTPRSTPPRSARPAGTCATTNPLRRPTHPHWECEYRTDTPNLTPRRCNSATPPLPPFRSAANTAADEFTAATMALPEHQLQLDQLLAQAGRSLLPICRPHPRRHPQPALQRVQRLHQRRAQPISGRTPRPDPTDRAEQLRRYQVLYSPGTPRGPSSTATQHKVCLARR